MSIHFGPFQVVYTSREQKMRDTIRHMIKRHGLAGARFRVIQEYLNACGNLGDDSVQAIWWNDMKWHIHQITSDLRWGQERGL